MPSPLSHRSDIVRQFLKQRKKMTIELSKLPEWAKLEVTKADLEALAETRLQDAILLLEAGRSSSAYYLAGNAVELGLKACVAKAFQPNAIPDKAFVNEIYTHSLEKLLGTAGLLTLFSADSKADPQPAALQRAVPPRPRRHQPLPRRQRPRRGDAARGRPLLPPAGPALARGLQ